MEINECRMNCGTLRLVAAAPLQFQYSCGPVVVITFLSLNHNFTVSPCPGANCSVPLWVSDPTLALAPDSAVAGEGGGAGSLVGVVITVLVLSLAITITVYYR